jgi:alkylation response protein AidB-like acyl-CoA dehydrogenase
MSAAITELDGATRDLLANTAARLVDEYYAPEARLRRLRKGSLDCRLHWSLLAELGILALPFSEGQGGISGSARAVAGLLQVLARGLLFEPLIEAAVIAGRVLSAGPLDAVTELISGQDISVLLGINAGTPGMLTAQMTQRGWRMQGLARSVPYAAIADHWLLAARETNSSEPLIFRVRRESVEAPIQPFVLIDARPAADVCVDDVVVDASSLLLRGTAAAEALESACLHAVSAYCADAVGCMSQLVKQTGEYLRSRVQFGAPLSTFQALQHRYADLYMLLVEARAVADALAGSLDHPEIERQRWLAFAAATTVSAASTRIGHEAIQLHGGMGVTEELIISHYNARLLTLIRLLRNVLPREPAAFVPAGAGI